MVLVPGGAFDMGADDGPPEERPRHRVDVAPFWIDVTEVTVAAYAACARAGACSPASPLVDVGAEVHDFTSNSGASCNGARADRQDHPVNCIPWSQADAYCRFAGKRLPTEEEWEYAARGGDGRRYAWGNEAPGAQLCWDGEGSDAGKRNRHTTCPVGHHRGDASPFGVLDMAGNVSEWTSNPWLHRYDVPGIDPGHVFRGGSWASYAPRYVTATTRDFYPPARYYDFLGFRCARTD
jgi:formylglycine-generating enzyme required for sulfatase activity